MMMYYYYSHRNRLYDSTVLLTMLPPVPHLHRLTPRILYKYMNKLYDAERERKRRLKKGKPLEFINLFLHPFLYMHRVHALFVNLLTVFATLDP